MGKLEQRASHEPAAGPFALTDDVAYRQWREVKLRGYPETPGDLMVEIRDPSTPTPAELEALVRVCRKTNVVFYAASGPAAPRLLDKGGLRHLCERLGLTRLDHNLGADEDAITSLQVVADGHRGGYIPYTNRPLNWHTDGYYNPPEHKIRAWSLYCVQDAASGGENAFLDHEIAYILLRDHDPEYVAALMHPEAMTIPANQADGSEIRATQTGPVFSTDPGTGTLHMRYTARKRNVIWRNDPATRAAAAYLESLFEHETNYLFRWRLTPGQGVLSNNVLHKRKGFSDAPGAGKKRLIYRARYYDRIAGTEHSEIYPRGVQHAVA